MREKLEKLLPEGTLEVWDKLTAEVDELYDVDHFWSDGFGDWKVECKYRRGGKTLCTFYAKEDTANVLITYGKAEREKFERIRSSLAASIRKLYDSTETFHDGKWLWIPLNDSLSADDLIAMLKLKRRPNRKSEPSASENVR